MIQSADIVILLNRMSHFYYNHGMARRPNARGPADSGSKNRKKRLFQMPLEGLIELFQIGLFMRVRYATIVYQSIS